MALFMYIRPSVQINNKRIVGLRNERTVHKVHDCWQLWYIISHRVHFVKRKTNIECRTEFRFWNLWQIPKISFIMIVFTSNFSKTVNKAIVIVQIFKYLQNQSAWYGVINKELYSFEIRVVLLIVSKDWRRWQIKQLAIPKRIKRVSVNFMLRLAVCRVYLPCCFSFSQ